MFNNGWDDSIHTSMQPLEGALCLRDVGDSGRIWQNGDRSDINGLVNGKSEVEGIAFSINCRAFLLFP